jgi:outer membrane protein
MQKLNSELRTLLRKIYPMRILAFMILITAAGFTSATAQRSKMAYINTNELWNRMPEKAIADSTLEKEAAEYRKYLANMVNELKQLQADYQKSYNGENTVLSQEKEKDILARQKRIEEYTANADKELNLRKEELYSPIRKKMQEAIDKVALRLKYDYVIDASFGNIIYRRTEEDNLMPQVVAELGIK